VLRILTTRAYRDYIRGVCVGGIDKRQINKSHIESFPIISPPSELQTRFASIVESIEQQKARLKVHLAELDTLFASLQSRAFNGELMA
jgi:type I restriction enzyme S subunit